MSVEITSSFNQSSMDTFSVSNRSSYHSSLASDQLAQLDIKIRRIKNLNKSLSDEEAAIVKLRELISDSAKREELEYTEQLSQLKSKQEELAALKERMVDATKATERLEEAKKLLNSKRKQVDLLTEEKAKGNKEVSRLELEISQCKEAVKEKEREQEKLSELEAKNQEIAETTVARREELASLKKSITQKRRNIESILKKADEVESHLDEILEGADLYISTTSPSFQDHYNSAQAALRLETKDGDLFIDTFSSLLKEKCKTSVSYFT